MKDKYTKSLNALKKALKTIPKERILEIIKEVDAMNIEGPTIEEYFEKVWGNPTKK